MSAEEFLVVEIKGLVERITRARERTVEHLAKPSVAHREFWQGHLDYQNETLAYWRGRLAFWEAKRRG